MERTCVVCRATGPAEVRVRLALRGGELRLAPQKAAGERGYWLCARRVCVEGLNAKTVGRALKGPGRVAPGLLDALRVRQQRALEAALQRCFSSGLCADGREAALTAAPQAALVLHAADAAPIEIPDGIPTFPTHLDRVALGRLLGRGPRSIVAVRPGRPARTVAHVLQCLSWLG